jgi:hypothetical protein
MLSLLSISTTLRICREIIIRMWSLAEGSASVTYVDGTETGAVTGSHVLVEGLNSVGAAHLAELLVHVVGAGARVVADPDTEVLDLEGTLLLDLDTKT